MSEYTKGESKILEILMSAWVRGWYSGINGDNSDGKKRVDCPEVMGIYAKEFVRRYNAFEEGGIVSDLVKDGKDLLLFSECSPFCEDRKRAQDKFKITLAKARPE